MIPEFVVTQWFSIIQTVGIIGGLFFTAWSFGKEARQKKIANRIELTKGHREIWGQFIDKPELERVVEHEVDLVEKPITQQETHFVRLVILHLNCAYLMETSDLTVKIEKLSADVKDFFTRPIPNAVWQEVKPFQNKALVRFVERSLSEKRK